MSEGLGIREHQWAITAGADGGLFRQVPAVLMFYPRDKCILPQQQLL